MRDDSKRISVVVGKEQHKKWKIFAKNYTQGSVSQLIRCSVDQKIHQNQRLLEKSSEYDLNSQVDLNKALKVLNKRIERLSSQLRKKNLEIKDEEKKNTKIQKGNQI